jgi:hypothetical protein
VIPGAGEIAQVADRLLLEVLGREGRACDRDVLQILRHSPRGDHDLVERDCFLGADDAGRVAEQQ